MQSMYLVSTPVNTMGLDLRQDIKPIDPLSLQAGKACQYKPDTLALFAVEQLIVAIGYCSHILACITSTEVK